MSQPARAWTLADAKAHLSEVVDNALKKGPQVITRRGRKAVVVVAAEEWERKTQRQGTLADFFAASPLRESGLEIERPRMLIADPSVRERVREITFALIGEGETIE